ncbi:MAG TPA: hypothetical protein VIU65_03005 [Pyrinomonadaceae bacterium]
MSRTNTPNYFSAQHAKRLIPAPLKRAVREAFSKRDLHQAIRQIKDLSPGTVPSHELLNLLQRGWGNGGFAATIDYLDEVAKFASTTTGPILECGSGLTTLLLGLIAGRRGIETWSLEHISEWRTRVAGLIERFEIPNSRLCLAPLKDYGEFTWYDAPLGEMPQNFALVICDGPPGATPGGRYGLLPILGERLSKGSVILLDDATRPGEAEVLSRWKAEAPVSISFDEEKNQTFAVIIYG